MNDSWVGDPYIDKGQGWCSKAGGLAFIPSNCYLKRFTMSAFLNLIAGRKLVLLGDSVTRQFYEYVIGRMRRYQTYNPNIPHGPLEYPIQDCSPLEGLLPTSPKPRLSRGCYHGTYKTENFCTAFKVPASKGKKAAHICFIYSHLEVLDEHNIGAFNSLSRKDIVVANTGVHYNFPAFTRRYLRRFVGTARTARSENGDRPLLLWRETSSQHFAGGKAGYWPADHTEELQLVRDGLRTLADPENFRCQVGLVM